MKYKLKINDDLKDSVAYSSLEAVPISLKKSVEICHFLKGKKIDVALDLLRKIIRKEVAVPFKKSKSAPHKRNIGPGKYPVKTATYFLKLIKNVQANAEDKGLSEDIIIYHISADKSFTQARYGRKNGIHAKRTNIQVIVKEVEGKGEKKENKSKETKPKTQSQQSTKPTKTIEVSKETDNKKDDKKVTSLKTGTTSKVQSEKSKSKNEKNTEKKDSSKSKTKKPSTSPKQSKSTK